MRPSRSQRWRIVAHRKTNCKLPVVSKSVAGGLHLCHDAPTGPIHGLKGEMRMSHEIDESTGKPAFVFDAAEGEAWHQLGVAIPAKDSKDPAKIAALAGGNYEVG